MANCYDCIVPPPVCPPPDGDNQGEEVLTGFACTPTPILVPASTEESIFESGSTVAPNILATDPPPQPPPPPSPPEASDSATQPVGKVVFNPQEPIHLLDQLLKDQILLVLKVEVQGLILLLFLIKLLN